MVETFIEFGPFCFPSDTMNDQDDAARPEICKHTWPSILVFGLLVFLVFTFGTMFEMLVTRGVCFVYVISYFLSFAVVLAIRRIGMFGTGLAVFLPYAIMGVFVEYWMEWVDTPSLIAPWAAVVWSMSGVVAGLCADLAHRFLPRSIKEQYRSALVGMIAVFTYWLLTLLVLASMYKDPTPGLAHYLNGIYITLPWLLVSGCFGGYTACAMSRSALNGGQGARIS